MTDDKELTEAFHRVWTIMVLVFMVLLPCAGLTFSLISGGNIFFVLLAVGAIGVLLYGLWTYREWARKGAQALGCFILGFMAFHCYRAPSTYDALNWLFSPFSIMSGVSSVYCIGTGYRRGVRKIFAAQGILGDSSARSGRTAFVLKRGVLLFIGYAVWMSACGVFNHMADQAVADANSRANPSK